MSGNLTKKAIISTFTYGNNYGQRLQNLALQNIFTEHGYETWTFKQPADNYNKNKAKKLVKHPQNAISEMRRTKIFNDFNNKYIKLYNANSSMEKLYDIELKDEFDLFITGSDQVWNPYSSDVNESHFLTFVPPQGKIAFAPSFSVDSIPEDKKEQYRGFLDDFQPKNLSVRETQGANIIKELIGEDVPVILDPTFMYDEEFWLRYSLKPSNEISDEYILIYVLGEIDMQEIKSNYPDVKIIDILRDKQYYSSVGPQEFLWIIKNASMIITDSYHCMIFNLLFDKKFQMVSRKSKGFSMKSRISTICEKFSIPEENIFLGSDLNFKISHELFINILKKERKKTELFLDNAII